MTPIFPSEALRAIVLDTETTGLRDPEPCEVACIYLRGLEHYPDKSLITEKHETFQDRFKPGKPIEYGAQQIHGITIAMVADKEKFSMAALGLPSTVEYLICHNVSYDFRVLRKPEGLKKICTVKLAKRLWPELKSHKLTLLIEEFFPEVGKQLTTNAHGALVDSKLCLLILYQAIQEFNLETWEEVYEIGGQK
jgi:exodeoxyribonuclease X